MTFREKNVLKIRIRELRQKVPYLGKLGRLPVLVIAHMPRLREICQTFKINRNCQRFSDCKKKYCWRGELYQSFILGKYMKSKHLFCSSAKESTGWNICWFSRQTFFFFCHVRLNTAVHWQYSQQFKDQSDLRLVSML